MRIPPKHLQELNLKISITNPQGEEVNSYATNLEDYLEETIGKKCTNLADQQISNMVKNINEQYKLKQHEI